MCDSHVVERLVRQRQTLVFLEHDDGVHTSPSPSFRYCVQCSGYLLMSVLGPECLNWYGTMVFDRQGVCCFPELCSEFQESERPQSLVLCTAFQNWRQLSHPSPDIHSSGGHCPPKPPFFVKWFLSFGHTIRLQLSKTPFFAPIKSSLWSCASSPGLKYVCSPGRKGDCHQPVHLPCELVRYGRRDWRSG